MRRSRSTSTSHSHRRRHPPPHRRRTEHKRSRLHRHKRINTRQLRCNLRLQSRRRRRSHTSSSHSHSSHNQVRRHLLSLTLRSLRPLLMNNSNIRRNIRRTNQFPNLSRITMRRIRLSQRLTRHLMRTKTTLSLILRFHRRNLRTQILLTQHSSLRQLRRQRTHLRRHHSLTTRSQSLTHTSHKTNFPRRQLKLNTSLNQRSTLTARINLSRISILTLSLTLRRSTTLILPNPSRDLHKISLTHNQSLLNNNNNRILTPSSFTSPRNSSPSIVIKLNSILNSTISLYRTNSTKPYLTRNQAPRIQSTTTLHNNHSLRHITTLRRSTLSLLNRQRRLMSTSTTLMSIITTQTTSNLMRLSTLISLNLNMTLHRRHLT